MIEIETFKKLGLTDYEAKITLALMKLGPSKVSEIYKECYVPKNKIYESLQSLIRKSIAEVMPTIPKKYLVKNINSFSSLLNKKEEEIEDIKKSLEHIKNMKQNIQLSSAKEPVLIVYGHEPFLTRLKGALSKVSKENLIVARKLKSDPIIMRLTKEAIKRGAKVKMIIKKTKDPIAKEWKEIGVKIRYIEDIPNMPFSTFDNFVCRINLNVQDNINDPTLWIESSQFIQILRERFNNLWKQAKK